MMHGGNVWEGGEPGRWLDFSANLRPEGPPDWALETMRRALADVRFYPERAMRSARRGLAGYAGVPEGCILPTAGGAAAIDLALSLGRGRVLLCPPTFGEYARRAQIQGRGVRCLVGAGQVGEAHAGDTLVLCNPNNPTGSALTREAVLDLHARLRAQGAGLIVDEAFIDFCPALSVRDRVSEGLCVVGSLTKTLGIPGVRLGYVCAAPDDVLALQKRALPWSLGALASAVAAHLPEHLAQIREDAARNVERRERFARLLCQRGVQVTPSQANFLLADFGRDMTDAVAALKARGILVRTCASFGLGPELLRLAVKTDEENKRLVEALWACF